MGTRQSWHSARIHCFFVRAIAWDISAAAFLKQISFTGSISRLQDKLVKLQLPSKTKVVPTKHAMLSRENQLFL